MHEVKEEELLSLPRLLLKVLVRQVVQAVESIQAEVRAGTGSSVASATPAPAVRIVIVVVVGCSFTVRPSSGRVGSAYERLGRSRPAVSAQIEEVPEVVDRKATRPEERLVPDCAVDQGVLWARCPVVERAINDSSRMQTLLRAGDPAL